MVPNGCETWVSESFIVLNNYSWYDANGITIQDLLNDVKVYSNDK